MNQSPEAPEQNTPEVAQTSSSEGTNESKASQPVKSVGMQLLTAVLIVVGILGFGFALMVVLFVISLGHC